MVETTKKKSRIFDYFCEEEQFSGGVAWCAGCPLELIARFVPKVLGKNMVFVGTLSGAAERNEKIIYITYDNEGYMNTGNQRSSATPLGAATTTTPVGKAGHGKLTMS